MSRLLRIVAIVLFILAGVFDVSGTWHPFALLAFGLAAYTVADFAPATL